MRDAIGTLKIIKKSRCDEEGNKDISLFALLSEVVAVCIFCMASLINRADIQPLDSFQEEPRFHLKIPYGLLNSLPTICKLV